MPEIRLGAAENFSNINLGATILQEIWLGPTLVWQNNQGPVFANIVWDAATNTFTVPGFPMDVEDWTYTPPTATFAGQVNGTAGTGTTESRNITLVINTIQDNDNVPGEPVVDFPVGFRLQRPDDTWAFGDPNSMATNAAGAPIADYGTVLPGLPATLTYNAATDEWTGMDADATDATSSITVPIRATNAAGDVIDTDDATLGAFVDAGPWELIVIDSRGGESPLGTIMVNIAYQAPDGTITGEDTTGAAVTLSGSIANPTIANTDHLDLELTQSGGPITVSATDQWEWSCAPAANCVAGTAAVAGTWVIDNSGGFDDATQRVYPPTATGGNATNTTFTVTTLGRSWAGNNITARTSFTTANMTVGAACTPSYSINESGWSFSSGCPSGTTATYTGTDSVNCTTTHGSNACGGSPSTIGFATGTTGSGSFTIPDPGCPTGSTTANTATYTVSGGEINVSGSIISIPDASVAVSGSFPDFASTCDVTINCAGPVAAHGGACGTTVTVANNCSGNDCDGTTTTGVCNQPTGWDGGTNGDPDNYSLAASSATQCSGAGGTSTGTATFSAISPTFGMTCAGTPTVGDDGATWAPANCTITQTNAVTITAGVTFTITGFGTCGAPGDSLQVIGQCSIVTADNGEGVSMGCNGLGSIQPVCA